MSERVRYESEASRAPVASRDRAGGASTAGSSSGETPWVGAFERVFGEHGRDELDAERDWRPRNTPAGAAHASASAGCGAVRIIAKDSQHQQQSEAGTTPDTRYSSASAASSAPSSQGDNVYGTSPLAAASRAPQAMQLQRSRSGSNGGGSSSNEASLKPPKAASPRAVPTSSAAGVGSYSLAPPRAPSVPVARSVGDEPAARLQCTSSGPSLVSTSESCIVLEDVYVNHAPSLHTFTLRNTSDAARCLVRLESDLGRGISFLKRRRTAPLETKESLYFPANSVSWARADGLSASRLRDLRQFVANLEPADSFILEAGAQLPLWLSFRPIHFVSDTTGERTLLPPRSPTIEYAASTSPPRQVQGREGSLASRSSSNSSAITSPAFTTTSLAQPQLPGTPQPPHADLSLFSPRSAPELMHRGAAVPPIVHRAFEVRGTITLRASPLAAAASDNGAATDDAAHFAHISSGASNLSSASASSCSRPTSHYSSQVSSGIVSTASATTTEPPAQHDEGQTLALPFYARSCRPQLALELEHAPGEAADAASQRPAHVHGLITLDLGDTFVGQREERELVLRNQSEIECLWQARIDDADADASLPHLALVHADSGEAVDVVRAADEVQYRPQVILPRATHRMRLSLQAREAGTEFEQLVTLTNMHNASNSIRLLVRANVLLHATDDALAVTSGDTVDFGDCCGGHWARQLLVLKNMSDACLDVALGVQRGVEANFQLAELAPQQEDVQDETPLPTPAMGSTPSVLGTNTGSSVFTESEAGGTTSSLSGATSGAGSSAGAAVASHFLSPASETGRSEGEMPISAEQARTPTSHPRPPPASEPPFFELPQSDASAADSPRPPLSRKDTATSEMTEGTEDEIDASSVASQAGSAPGSPVRTRPPATLRSTVVEALLARPASQHSSYGPPTAPAGAGTAEVYSEGDRASMASLLRNRPSTGLFPRPPSSAARSAARGEEWSVTDDALSMRSDATALSQDSRLGPFAASVASHAGSAGGVNRLIHSGAGATLMGLKTTEQTASGQLRDLVLKPGVEYRIVVSYRPKRGEPDEDFTAGKLVEDIFRISLDYARADGSGAPPAKSKAGRQRKTVLCRTRTCTSFITVSPKVVDLGESNVGARKSAHVAVENRSELTARIDVRFVSKVLSMYTGEVAIPARQTVELRVDFFPRRVNEAYRKQITVANLMNRNDDQILEVRSRNVDRQRVSLHSLVYRILTPSGANFIDFGDVNINSTRVRTFSIENISDAKVALELSAAHPEDLKLYVKAPVRPLPSPTLSATSGAGNGELFPATPAPSKAVHAVRTPSRYAELEASDAPAAVVEPEGAAPKSAKPMMSGIDLKERFLETISVDSPASIRRENATWRLAQKHSHFRAVPDGKGKGKASGSSGKKDPSAPPKVKAPINLVAALKKGGKGRITLQWGKSMTFKDRKILSEFEALDLATGPPVDAKRIPLKSKRYQTLETIELGHKPKGSAGATSGGKSSSKSSRAPAEASTDGTAAAGEAQPTSGHVASASGASNTGSIGVKAGKKARASAVSRKLPSMLAADIHSKAGSRPSTGGSRIAREGSTASTSESCRSPALTGKSKAQCLLSDAVNVSKLSTDEFIAAIEAQNPSLSAFFLGSKELEEKIVRTEINLQRELHSAISNGRLVPVDTLDLDPKQERQVVAVYTPNGSTRPHIQGNARKQDSRIFMRLLEYNKALVRAASAEPGAAAADDEDDYELPVRDLMVRATVCRSLLELGQPHINFGHMEKGQSKTRKITIQNRSEWALRYCIRKSGSIASGDIKIAAGLYGLVPGHGKREIEFVFSPSLSGPFQEKLVVENVADRDRDGTLSLKATVRKVPNFAVEPTAIDFGACLPGKLTPAEGFVVTNTTAKPRTFVVAVDSEDLRHQRSIVDVILAAAADTAGVRGTLSKAEEEELEHISQKLKIAIRKGHEDKVKKYESRLAELGVAPAVPVEGEENAVVAASDAQSDAPPPTPATGEPTRLKRVASTVTIGLAAGQSKRLLIRLRPHAVHTVLGAEHTAAEAAAAAALSTPSAVAEAEDVGVRVQIHEVKNRDEMKTVEVRARVELPKPRLCATTEECERVADPLPLDDSIVFSSTTPH